ncbi:MAG: thioredoxin family protein, partial [Deltaproteobacteria bacterium]|nr:thioredoxin family protein [Deltaproteobacteria bacterium]
MMLKIPTLLVSALSLASAAQAPDFTVVAGTKAGKPELVAAPPAGHHFNVKAPMELDDSATGSKLEPSKATTKAVTFRFADARARQAIVRLYLCDDANKYCEKHEVSLKVEGSAGPADPAPRPQAPATGGATAPAHPTFDHGFRVNDPKAAFAEAVEKKRPVMIDFFGIWCPPCNMLDEEVFVSPEFKKASAKFVKLKLDVDAPVSWELKAKYKIAGYPTIIFASPDGEEISRIVGYRAKKEFASDVERAWSGREETYSKLKETADAGDALAAARVGKLHLERHEYELARKYLEKAPTEREAFFDAKIGELEAAGKDARETLEAALREFPDSPNSVDRRLKLAEAFESAKETERHKAQLKEAATLATRLAGQPEKLAGYDSTPGDLLETAADTLDKLGLADEARATWKRAAVAYHAQASRVASGRSRSERGYNLEYAFCLWKSGEKAKADEIYRGLEKKYPREFTFYYNHGRMNFELKQFADALPLARKAYEFSYGDNRLR